MAPLGSLHYRHLFHSREQKETETVEDFVYHVKNLSAKCGYQAPDEHIQALVLDRVIVGLRNKEAQSRLIKNPSNHISLEDVFAMVKNRDIKPIKQENEAFEDIITKVEINEAPDVSVTDEVKVAILIELMNHKAVISSPSGNENEKAQLWDQVYRSSQDMGSPFKSALHLREVFATWKQSALRNKQEDVKLSNADKLVCDLYVQDSEYQVSNVIENHEDFETRLSDDQEMFNYDENDMRSSSSESEHSEYLQDEDFKPLKRGRGRPRKSSPPRCTSTSISPEVRILILRRLLLQKDIIGKPGNEKQKKDIWRNLFQSLETKLVGGSPSSLRTAFR